MVSLNQEEITNRLLRKYHLYGQTELTTFLFDAETLARIETAFEGLPSAFSKKDLRGTFLFWYFPIESKKRIALWLDGKHLVSADGVHRIPLTPESLDTLLEQKLLIPSMMLSLVTLSFYYGIKCLGGFSQVNYLTWFDKAYRDVLNQPQSAGDEFTQGFCGEFLIGFLKTTAALTPATGIDFVIHADDTAWKRFESVLMHLSLRDVHSLMLPELYRVVYNNSEREEALLSIKFSDMSNVLSQSKSLIPTLLVNS
jgi:hypothetical protein